jgi:HEPN domain-containing protein
MAVKGALDALGKEMRGHDVHRLLESLSQYREEVLQFIEEAKVLDQYYIPTRYANAFAEGSAKAHFTERQAKEAIKTAENILSQMKRISYG